MLGLGFRVWDLGNNVEEHNPPIMETQTEKNMRDDMWGLWNVRA